MQQENEMDTKKLMWSLLFMLSGIASFYSIAKTPVATISVNEPDYELSHEGLIQVNATLFSAPCDIYVSKKNIVTLTGCGAGSAYKTQLKLSHTANTPANLRFYDYNGKQFSSSYSLHLLDGDNSIQTPLLMGDDSLRLEVSYE